MQKKQSGCFKHYYELSVICCCFFQEAMNYSVTESQR